MGGSLYFEGSSLMVLVYMFLIAGVLWVWGFFLYKILDEILPKKKSA